MDAPEGYEEQLEDLTEKELMLEIMVELKTIRYGLQTGDFGTLEGDDPEQPTLYECNWCSKSVPEGEREQHLVQQHNAPDEPPIEAEFSQV